MSSAQISKGAPHPTPTLIGLRESDLDAPRRAYLFAIFTLGTLSTRETTKRLVPGLVDRRRMPR